ncbi:hypothetical protein Pelo_13894 [Pelomyxa schiedti]|nr:hypothetical protein Pelo_13894 [Pelomyxa schiedti]
MPQFSTPGWRVVAHPEDDEESEDDEEDGDSSEEGGSSGEDTSDEAFARHYEEVSAKCARLRECDVALRDEARRLQQLHIRRLNIPPATPVLVCPATPAASAAAATTASRSSASSRSAAADSLGSSGVRGSSAREEEATGTERAEFGEGGVSSPADYEEGDDIVCVYSGGPEALEERILRQSARRSAKRGRAGPPTPTENNT